MLRHRIRAAAIAAIVAIAPARDGRGQSDDPARTAAAQALLDSAKWLAAAGRFDVACPKLEEAVRLVPAGIGAKIRLAECYEGAGRLASAWTTWLVVESAARIAGQPDRALVARDRAEALRADLSTLVLVVPEEARAPGLSVRRDALDIGEALWGVPVHVDAGRHVITMAAPGRAPREIVVEVARGTAVTVRLDALGGQAAPAPPPPAAAQAPPADAPAPHGTPTWAWITGAGGLAAIAIGVGLRADVEVVQARQRELCGGDLDHCARATPGYDPADDNARKHRDFAAFVVLTVAGGLAVGAATVGLVAAPRAARHRGVPTAAAPWVGDRSGGLAARWSF